jgi:HEPN domain-containing protein
MPVDPHASTAQEWLKRGRSHLIRAHQPKPEGVLWEDLCFDAQQAAELAIKAILVIRGVSFPKIHDIRRLFDLLRDSGLEIPDTLRLTEVLTPYATEIRYPADFEPVTEEDFKHELSLAESVVSWAERLILGHEGPSP